MAGAGLSLSEGSPGASDWADEDVKTAENFLLRLGTLDMKWRYSDFVVQLQLH